MLFLFPLGFPKAFMGRPKDMLNVRNGRKSVLNMCAHRENTSACRINFDLTMRSEKVGGYEGTQLGSYSMVWSVPHSFLLEALQESSFSKEQLEASGNQCRKGHFFPNGAVFKPTLVVDLCLGSFIDTSNTTIAMSVSDRTGKPSKKEEDQ